MRCGTELTIKDGQNDQHFQETGQRPGPGNGSRTRSEKRVQDPVRETGPRPGPINGLFKIV